MNETNPGPLVIEAPRQGRRPRNVPPALPPRAVLLRACRRRDASYDGLFFTGVTTTGIFCRPTCPARRPKPEHMRFFATSREALFAGFRPCLRCRPLAPAGAAPPWLAPLLAAIERAPDRRMRDAELSRFGVDPSRVRRWFMKEHGMTFQAYARARRLGRAFTALNGGKKLDAVALDHGFESHSGFRDAFSKWFGAPPGRARPGDCIRFTSIESPVGPLLAASVKEGICLLEFNDRRMLEAQLETLKRRIGRPAMPGDDEHLRQLRRELAEYFAGTRRGFDVPVHAPGSDFQQKVWQGLRRIPWGETVSYRELAERIGAPKAARAVGRANGMNRVAIVIPCHRVVNEGGTLGGYGGGLWRKVRLLEIEGAATEVMKAAVAGGR
jgi:AraC family transcriptional regulator, regulatory protein of adaptative response / methylated-DNA-[protein]-cysteine methyltransferase